MSDTGVGEMLAAILDAVTLVQEQLEGIDARARHMEAQQTDIVARLEKIEGHALASRLDQMLTEMREGHDAAGEGFARVAEIAGWAHAAAAGNPAPLPLDIVDDPLLERYVLSQPADRGSGVRALEDWRRIAQSIDTEQLAETLRRQYRPSPTDTAEDRMLRYRLAAISREVLSGRGAVLPAPPSSTFPSDRSPSAQRARSAELLRVWREGEGAELLGEPALSGALDILAVARREGAAMPEAELLSAIAELRQQITDRLENGDRVALSSQREISQYQDLSHRTR